MRLAGSVTAASRAGGSGAINGHPHDFDDH
jgi:hypothetical protein